MGKTRHQKFLKSEKSKVKLKAKKELPKGTNVTNTTFKIKKIVLPEQSKQATGEPLSKSKLNLKELLSRLQHFNTNSRTEALNGIKQLITSYPSEMLTLHVGQLISGIAPLVLDKEKSVRRETYQTLHIVLSPLTIERITPFFEILCSYLRCAMTHIDTRIHEDSLFYFDILLSCAPNLLANNVHKILPSFLDMISKLKTDSKPGRTLSMNLGSKMTSVKWRTKVLLRLLQFLRVLVKSKMGSKEIEVNENDNSLNYLLSSENTTKNNINNRTVEFDKEKRAYYPLHRGITLYKLSCFSKSKDIFAKNDNNGTEIQSYADVLLPLLFDTWLEVRPATSDSNKKVESIVSEEGALILRYILEIFLLVWHLLKFTDEDLHNCELIQWFIKKYQKTFTQFILNGFPYSQSDVRGRKNSETQNIISGKNCLEENLIICHIYILLNEKVSNKSQQIEVIQILNYLKWSLDRISGKNLSCQLQMTAIFMVILKCDDWTKNSEMAPLLNELISIYKKDIDASFKQNIFALLCSILLNNNLMHLQCTKSFQLWLSNLPDVICKEKNIPVESFDIITRFAIQNNVLFNNSIKEKLKPLIHNLPNIDIPNMTDKREVKKKILNLLYWIDCWDTESLNVLQEQLETKCYDTDHKEYLVDILKLKTEGLFPM